LSLSLPDNVLIKNPALDLNQKVILKDLPTPSFPGVLSSAPKLFRSPAEYPGIFLLPALKSKISPPSPREAALRLEDIKAETSGQYDGQEILTSLLGQKAEPDKGSKCAPSKLSSAYISGSEPDANSEMPSADGQYIHPF